MQEHNADAKEYSELEGLSETLAIELITCSDF